MFASRIFHLFLFALGVAALAQAINMGADRKLDGANGELIVKRQTSPTVNADPTDTSASPTDEPTDETTKPTDEPTSTRNTDTSTSDPPKTTNRPTSTPTDTPEETTSEEPTPVTEVLTEVVTTTNADGSIETKTSETTSTRTPGLSEEKSGASEGMSTGTRNTVIGVVVGVGGAIVLGALAFVAWRIWGRKKNADENDGLMSYNTGYAPMDKSEAGSSAGGAAAARNPFQATLETYHAPTHVNASANF